jgi:hypothetical protein
MLIATAWAADAETGGYILEAEHSSGEWHTTPVLKSPYWNVQSLALLPELTVDRLYQNSYAMGALVEEDGVGSTSSIEFTPPEPGYYLLGVRMSTREEDGYGGQTHVTVMMRDAQGEIIPNELEVQALGYTWDVPVAAPVVGMWNLPAEPVTLIFQARASRRIFLDYFYLTPLFEADGAPRAYLPSAPWPVEGDWAWGEHLDFMITVSTMPGESSTIPLYASVPGDHLLYAYIWHDGDYEQALDLQIGAGEEAFSAQVDLPQGTYWKMAEIGPVHLEKGETTLRFTNNPENPPDAVIGIETIHVVPLGRTLEVLPDSHVREGVLRPDGLGDEWGEVPVLLQDPEGDQELCSDIKELRALVANGTLNLMVGFHELSEHSGFVLDVDFDGNEEPEYMVEGSSEGHWALINRPDSWTHIDMECATFEVMEMGIPLELLEPSLWDDHPETLNTHFHPEEITGFHVRLRLTNSEEPYELDVTDWAYLEVPDWQGDEHDATEGESPEETGDEPEEHIDEPAEEGAPSEEEPTVEDEPTDVEEEVPDEPHEEAEGIGEESTGADVEEDTGGEHAESEEEHSVEEERPRGVVGLIQDAISSLMNLLKGLFGWLGP